MKVAARPVLRVTNPWPALFARALQQRGLLVEEMSYLPRQFPKAADVIVLHWPDELFVQKSWDFIVAAVFFIQRMRAAKTAGTKLVWVVHNIEPHGGGAPPFETARQRFFSLLDGLVFLSEASRPLLMNRFPELATLPFVTIRHGHYRDLAVNAPTEATELTGREARLAFLGHVKRYKAPDALARVIAAMDEDAPRLKIAGHCSDEGLRAELEQIASASNTIELDLRRLTNHEIEQHVDAADAAILPYTDILNSGSAMLSLSRARPVIAPRLGSLEEVRSEVGDEWLWLYDGPLREEVIRDGVSWLRGRARGTAPDLSAHQWGPIGAQVAAFLRSL